MSVLLSFRYGAASYVLFLGTFVYAIGLIGNVVVANSAAGKPGMCVWHGRLGGGPIAAPVQPDAQCPDDEVVKIPRCEL